MASGFEDWSIRAFTAASEEEQQKAAVTDSETEMTFSAEVKSWRLYNAGPNACHYALVTGVDTNNYIIPPRSWLVEDVPLTTIYLICDTGETAAVYGAGLR